MAILYSILAMVGGVFYREFTKFNLYTEKTVLSVIHTHYFFLGMAFFLLLLLLEKSFSLTIANSVRILCVYHIVRGIIQVFSYVLSARINAAISGIAGIGHILLGVSIVLLLLQIRDSVLRVQA